MISTLTDSKKGIEVLRMEPCNGFANVGANVVSVVNKMHYMYIEPTR